MPDTLVRPAFHSVPEHDSTAGGEAADLAASVGLPVDGEQRLVLDAFLAERAGRWAAFECAAVVARQNGKTFGAEMAALHDVFLRRVDRVVWTAHRYKTTSDSFAGIAAVCENFDIDFMARSTGSGRGLDADVVVLDEAMFLTRQMMGALLPTLSAKPDPQVRYLSSAGLASSEVLRSLRDRGRPGGDPSLAYLEWADASPPVCGVEDCAHGLDAPGCALDDRERWRAANPALGRRITEDYIAAERRALPPEEFARERLGWWDDPDTGDAPLALAAWAALGNPDARPAGRLSLGADVAPGHASSSVYVFGAGPVPVGELIARAPGSSWLVARLADLVARHDVACVAVDPSGPVGSLVPAMQDAGLPLTLVEGKESVRACGSFAAAVADGTFRHRAEPDMAAAVSGARRRAVGDAWKWSRKDSTVDITGLVAATNALWAQQSAPSGDPGVYFL